MKKLKFVMAIISIAIMSACGNNAKTDSKDLADSINESNLDTTQGDTLGINATTISEEDTEFATAAADGGMAEVELGMLAQDKATDSQVKEFGKMMITDHTKANDELKALAKAKNIMLPAMPSDDNQKIKADLTKKTGKDFDKAYINEMVKDHKKDVKLFEDALTKVKDMEIKDFITKTLPTLKMHLSHIETLDKQK